MKAGAALIISIAFVTFACGSSPPTRYFTLTPVAPTGRMPSHPPLAVQVDAVHVPATLDRNEIVRQTGTHSMSISERDQWAAPLGEMASNVLAQNLAERMPGDTVLLSDAPAPHNASHLIVSLSQFREGPNRAVHLDGSWTLTQGEPAKPVLSRQVHLERTAKDGDAEAQAAAMSKLLADLADHIAMNIATNDKLIEPMTSAKSAANIYNRF